MGWLDMERIKAAATMSNENQDKNMLWRYQQLVEAAGDVIYTVGVDGICTYVNASVKRLFGYEPSEVVGYYYTTFIHTDWREKVETFYMEQLLNRTPETVLEFPAITRDGEVKWVEQIVILQIENDWPTAFYGFVRDVTRRKQAEDRLRAIIDAVPDHIYVKDTEHRFVLVNRATWMNEGYKSADEMIGLTDLELYGQEGTEDYELEDKLLKTGKPIYNLERENGNLPLPGKREIVLINKVPLMDDSGEITGLIGINRDITERKEAEGQLRQSENTLRTIIETSTDIIFIKDRNLRYTLFNPAGARLLNRSVESVIGKNDIDLFNEQVARETADIDRRILETGKPITYEIRRDFFDGEHWLLMTKYPFVSNQGEVIGIVGIGHDITERKRTEAALAESEHRYRAVVDGQTELICRFNPDTVLTFVNEAYCRYFGKQKEELIGQPFLNLIPPQEQEGVLRKIARMMDDPTPFSYEHMVIAADGNIRWQEWIDRVILDKEGEFVEFQSAGRDVTERRLAEGERDEYLQRLEVLQMVDTEMSQYLELETVLNTGLEAAVGLSNANAGAIHLIEAKRLKVVRVIGDYPPEMVGSFLPRNTGLIGRALRTQEAEFVESVKDDRDYRANVPGTVAQITVPLIARDELIGTINVQTSQPGLFTQKTFDFIRLLAARIASAVDNAKLYQMLEAQYQQVSELEQIKTQLIHVAAHDIRGPLGIISGYVQLLNDDPNLPLTSRHQEYMKFIGESIYRIDKISQDILTMERVERMQKGANVEALDLCELVGSVFQDFESQAGEKKLGYKLEKTQHEALLILGDSVFLRETVSNLISNAVKYTPVGGHIRVRTRLTKDEAIFEVEDTGYGIPEDQQNDLFKPFSRVKLHETREIKGTGLGLHLVKGIIERHNGHMIFHSVYGKGSTFGFALPLRKAAAKK
jgi:PAS domain S-box-containing protein